MYSNKQNVNILTSLLAAFGVKHVVVCPGSRNAPIVHNLNEHPQFRCHPVTDERSAGFMALGMALQDRNGLVAVCVTSGTALLNLIPAVAEAAYQHCGFIVISADRPAQWIDQLDGQTIPQPGALERFVAKSVNLPEPHNDEEQWYCNRLVNEAVIAMKHCSQPVHINVPITEPLFQFNVEKLPLERCVKYLDWNTECDRKSILAKALQFKRPMIVMGQMAPGEFPAALAGEMMDKVVMMYEPLSVGGMPMCFADRMLHVVGGNMEKYAPDGVLYFGGQTVSKRLRRFLRQLPGSCCVMMVNETGELQDVSQHTDCLVCGKTGEVATTLLENWKQSSSDVDAGYLSAWQQLRHKVGDYHKSFLPDYSSMLAVKVFEETVSPLIVHYANSMAVRLGIMFGHRHYDFCNRGVNGIEGSLSTAAGSALVAGEDTATNVFCVTGDLSFFYDENALWQQQLKGNLRILLLNNQSGAIFRTLEGLEASPACGLMVSGEHSLNAEGICRQFRLTYRCVASLGELAEGMAWLENIGSERPVVLEVVTSAAEDARVFREYYDGLRKIDC